VDTRSKIISPQAALETAERLRANGARLAAALAVVDYVVLPGEGELEPFLERLGATQVERREGADERLTGELSAHVRSRQHAS
jgi:hypothetical protein